jgi:tripartite-type tricarboxylate transporter receptor subunit TctC
VRIAASVLLTALSLAPAAATAQSYLTRPVRNIVLFSVGGAADTPARMLGLKLSAELGQQVLIDNRPGAGSTIGTELAAKAAPDGYTLLLVSNTHAINAGLYRKRKYDPIADSRSTSFFVRPALGNMTLRHHHNEEEV